MAEIGTSVYFTSEVLLEEIYCKIGFTRSQPYQLPIQSNLLQIHLLRVARNQNQARSTVEGTSLGICTFLRIRPPYAYAFHAIREDRPVEMTPFMNLDWLYLAHVEYENPLLKVFTVYRFQTPKAKKPDAPPMLMLIG
jgi:hypothetical protein